MSQAGALGPLSTAVAAVQALIQHFHDRGLIIGGVATSVLAVPRFTNDVDAVLLIALDDIPNLLGVAAHHDIVPRRTDAEQFARQNRVLLLRHEPTGINVDLSLGVLPFEEEAVERGVNRDVGPLTLRLPTPEDLIIMKAVANRPIDLADIQAIIRLTQISIGRVWRTGYLNSRRRWSVPRSGTTSPVGSPGEALE